MAIVVASIVMFIAVILFRISHFGMNPVRGGRPPSERMEVESANIRCGDEVHMFPMSLMDDDEVRFVMSRIGVVVMR